MATLGWLNFGFTVNTKGLKKGTGEARAELAAFTGELRGDFATGLAAAQVAATNLGTGILAAADAAANATGFKALGSAIASGLAPARAAVGAFAGYARDGFALAGEQAARGLAPIAQAGRDVRAALAATFAPAADKARAALASIRVVSEPAALALEKFGAVGAKLARSGLGRAFHSLRGAINGTLGPLAKIGAGLAALSVAGASAALASSAGEAWNNAGAASKAAERIGTTTESLAGLQAAYRLAGVDAGGMEGQLGKLGLKLSEAASGSGPAAEQLAKLGLSAETLASEDRVTAFRSIADAIAGLANPSEQAAAAAALFEEEGIGLLDVLKGGSAALDAGAEAAKRYGTAINSADAGSIREANSSFAELGLALDGIGTQLAAGVAPYVAAIAKGLAEWIGTGTGASDAIGAGLELIARGAAIGADAVDTIGEAFKFVRASATGVIAGVLEGITTLARGLETLLNKIPGVSVSFTETLTAISGDMRKLAGEQWDGFKRDVESDAGDNLTAAFAKVKAEADRKRAEAAATPAAAAVGAFTPPPPKPKDAKDAKPKDAAAKDAKDAKGKDVAAKDTQDAAAKDGLQIAGALEFGSAEARSAILAAQRAAFTPPPPKPKDATATRPDQAETIKPQLTAPSPTPFGSAEVRSAILSARGAAFGSDPGKATEQNTKAAAAALATHTGLLTAIAANVKKANATTVDL